ncbi:MAG: hypothetical protein JWM16_58, partial [Verrucomicrobiales bacterium]|nr:hypothetical protein [Verrucomicrobiales bacterium]
MNPIRVVRAALPVPISRVGGKRGLLDLGKVRKEFAGGKGPLRAERAGARESLVVFNCSYPLPFSHSFSLNPSPQPFSWGRWWQSLMRVELSLSHVPFGSRCQSRVPRPWARERVATAGGG